MIITYDFPQIQDDSGVLVSGATVTVASVTDKAGNAIASHGATVNLAGANCSVDYDAESKGDAWITLAVSKVGSTFTNANAAPSRFCVRDASRINTALPDAAVPDAEAIRTEMDDNSTQLAAIAGYTDTLETAIATLQGVINIINTNTDSLEAGQATLAGYTDTLEGAVAALQSAVNAISDEVWTTEQRDAVIGKILALGSGTATVNSSFLSNNTLSLKKGDDYSGADALTFTVSKNLLAGVTAGDITEAKFGINGKAALQFTGTLETETADSFIFSVELSSTDTANLAVKGNNYYDFQVSVTGNKDKTRLTGALIVSDDYATHSTG